jgi:hypothetical protein
MRWVLPGGAVLERRDRGGNEREVACRPRAAVLEALRPPPPPPRWLWRFQRWLLRGIRHLPGRVAALFSREGLLGVKLWLEVLGLLVGLIVAILGLLAALQK